MLGSAFGLSVVGGGWVSPAGSAVSHRGILVRESKRWVVGYRTPYPCRKSSTPDLVRSVITAAGEAPCVRGSRTGSGVGRSAVRLGRCGGPAVHNSVSRFVSPLHNSVPLFVALHKFIATAVHLSGGSPPLCAAAGCAGRLRGEGCWAGMTDMGVLAGGGARNRRVDWHGAEVPYTAEENRRQGGRIARVRCEVGEMRTAAAQLRELGGVLRCEVAGFLERQALLLERANEWCSATELPERDDTREEPGCMPNAARSALLIARAQLAEGGVTDGCAPGWWAFFLFHAGMSRFCRSAWLQGFQDVGIRVFGAYPPRVRHRCCRRSCAAVAGRAVPAACVIQGCGPDTRVGAWCAVRPRRRGGPWRLRAGGRAGSRRW